jgi:hypothetical protein
VFLLVLSDVLFKGKMSEGVLFEAKMNPIPLKLFALVLVGVSAATGCIALRMGADFLKILCCLEEYDLGKRRKIPFTDHLYYAKYTQILRELHKFKRRCERQGSTRLERLLAGLYRAAR